jgi:hypothetical protein
MSKPLEHRLSMSIAGSCPEAEPEIRNDGFGGNA